VDESEGPVLKLTTLQLGGAVAQLGARLDGIEEVVGSNPIGSTNILVMPYHLYILQSETTSRYYVGQSFDVHARVAYHNSNYSLSLKNRGIPSEFATI
jgi:hypothetical protein